MLALRIALLAYFNAALQITQLNKIKKVLGFTFINLAHFAFFLLMHKTQNMTNTLFSCVRCLSLLRDKQKRKQCASKAAGILRARVYPCDARLVVWVDNLGWCFF